MVDRHKLTVFYLKSFDMDSVQVGKAVFGKEIYTTLGIEPRTAFIVLDRISLNTNLKNVILITEIVLTNPVFKSTLLDH